MGEGKRKRARLERSAGGVVLREIAGEMFVLLICDPYGKWGLPKGHLEDGERAVDAAVREVREETGLQATAGPLIGTIDWYFRVGGELVHKYCDFFLMSAPEGEAVPEQAEGITACSWLTWEEAMDRIDYDNAREMVRSALEAVEGDSVSLSFET